MLSLVKAIKRALLRPRRSTSCRQSPARRLGFESLESRRVLSADALGAIGGVAFSDLSDDGLTADDVLLSNVTIKLYDDSGPSAWLFDPGDSLLDSQLTGADGAYRFDGLAAGTYFVEQVGPAGFQQHPGQNIRMVEIDAAAASGSIGVVIDTFDAGSQVVFDPPTVPFPNHQALVVDAANVMGSERDLFAQATSGTVGMSVDPGFGLLEFNSTFTGSGIRRVVWDGIDGDATTLNATGLGGIDLTGAGANTGLLLSTASDLPGGELTVRVYTDSGNYSETSIVIPVDGPGDEIAFAAFTDFVPQAGTGADFANVGAVELEISGGVAVDGIVGVFGAAGPSVFTENFANLEPLSLGDTVWDDLNNNGVLDNGEAGIDGVVLNLVEDSNGDNSFSPGVDQFVRSTTTGPSGFYSFETLLPGSYIVQIDPANFDAGGPLHAFTSSTGNGVAPDPDNNVNNDDNGEPLVAAGIVSRAVDLAAREEPTDDGDSFANTNMSVDFGVYAPVDLAIVKQGSSDPVSPGQQFQYTLTVTNNGAGDATGVTVVDTLPAGVTFVSGQDHLGGLLAESGGQVSATIGDLASGQSVGLTITVEVDSSTIGVITNTATVSGDQIDPVPDNNTDPEETTVNPLIDLQIIKDDNVDPVSAGGEFTYTMIVTNNGPSDATGVSVSDQLPVEVTYVSATTTQGATNHDAGLFTANLGGLASGQSAEITVTVSVDDNFVGTIVNTAVVSGNEPEQNLQNNTAPEETNVTPLVDLEITKSDDVDPVLAGEEFTYTMVVTNNGPSDATGVVVSDALPAEVTFVSATTTQGDTQHDAGLFTADLGDLANGQSAQITLTVSVDADHVGTILNTAIVSANEAELNLQNNTAPEETFVEPRIIPTAVSSIAGFVYLDANDDGIFDTATEMGLSNVLVRLTGMDINNNPVDLTTSTGINGAYSFNNLQPGTYKVTEIQATSYRDGKDTKGTPDIGDVLDDMFDNLVLPAAGIDLVDYNFGEQSPLVMHRFFSFECDL